MQEFLLSALPIPGCGLGGRVCNAFSMPSPFNRAPVFDNLASLVTSPKFQPWEVDDQRPKLNFDIAAAENQPNTGMLN